MLYVYFIQTGSHGPVKIGVARDPEARLADLQGANADELRLLAAVPGSLDRERELHRRFADGRIRGEWFVATTPGLPDEIAKAKREEWDYEFGERLCAHCGVRPVMPPRTKVCSDRCYQARKREISATWKAARKS